MDQTLTFTVPEAIEFAQRGEIEEWVHLFLNSVGDNVPFSQGLKCAKRYWLGPILIPLDQMKRCTGPEPEMQFVDSREAWEAHIGHFQELVRQGWDDMPPLIVEDADGELLIRDGNHRWEALKREQVEECWAIIWGSESQEALQRLEKYCRDIL